MNNFLDRLKKKDIVPSNADDAKQAAIVAQNTAVAVQPDAPVAEQLRVDIFQTANAILIYAQLAGSNIHDYGVTIDGDGDIVTIKGQRTRPNGDMFQHPGVEEKESVLEECSWGPFYRQIILPAEVDAAKAEAKMREGVLVLYLPLKQAEGNGIRIHVTEV